MSTCTCEKQDQYANCCRARRYEEEAARLKLELSSRLSTRDARIARLEEALRDALADIPGWVDKARTALEEKP